MDSGLPPAIPALVIPRARVFLEATDQPGNLLGRGHLHRGLMLKQSSRPFTNHAVGRAVRIAIERSAGRVLSVFGDTRRLQNIGIDGDDVSGGVSDADRVLGRSLIEIVPIRMAAKHDIIVAAAGDKHSVWSIGGFLLQRRNQFVHALDFVGPQPGCRVGRIIRKNGVWMKMDVVEARRDGLAREVNDPRCRTRQPADLGVGSDSGEASVIDRESLRAWGLDASTVMMLAY